MTSKEKVHKILMENPVLTENDVTISREGLSKICELFKTHSYVEFQIQFIRDMLNPKKEPRKRKMDLISSNKEYGDWIARKEIQGILEPEG